MTITEFTPNITPEAIGWPGAHLTEQAAADPCPTWCDGFTCAPFVEIDGTVQRSHQHVIYAIDDDTQITFERNDSWTSEGVVDGPEKLHYVDAVKLAALGIERSREAQVALWRFARQLGNGEGE